MDRERLVEVPPPDLSQVEERVRDELLAAATEFSKMAAISDVSDRELGSAYGELGGVYHAHHMDDAAEACYRNAEQLAPQEFSWPYLLGYLYQGQGRLEKAAAAYRRARVVNPDYPPLRLRLADAYTSLNQPERARSLLQPALERQETYSAAAYRLGKIALLEGRYQEAVQWLQKALVAAPQADRIHYQLAMAYRGLGDLAEARAHVAQRGDIEPPYPDPVAQTLEQLVAGARTHLYRAMQAVWAKKFGLAAHEFQQVVRLEPDNVPARVGLARALYLIGKEDAARAALEAALAHAPEDAQAHYFLGRLRQETDSDAAAQIHFEAALAADPQHGGAHFFLANTLMRAGDFALAARHYGKAVELLPDDLPARQLEAVALIATPAQHPIARQRLETATALYPNDAVLRQALARLLAASPNAGLRDGKQALGIAKGLLDRVNSIEHAETVAMAYAELGRYREAAAFQQAALDAAVQWGGLDLLPRLQENLRRYHANKPCRDPWPADDPVFYPRPLRAVEEAIIATTQAQPPPAPP
nr:tetratricopeptide repeat protein [Gammaproteobacteria bacterium]